LGGDNRPSFYLENKKFGKIFKQNFSRENKLIKNQFLNQDNIYIQLIDI